MIAVVLAGGRSRRMQRDKRLLEHEGLPLVRAFAGRVHSLGLPCFMMSPFPAVVCPVPGFAVIHDEQAGRGAAPSLRQVLTWMGEDVLLLAADLPRLSVADLSELLAAAARSPSAPAVAAWTGNWEPLCAVYRPAALPSLVKMSHGSLNRWLHGEAGAVRHEMPPENLVNLNSPDDLRYLQAD